MTPPFKEHLGNGFTLVELAVVLVIITTVMTFGLGAINAQLISSNYSSTKKRQEVIKDVLVAYFGVNKRLPCPEIPTSGTPVTGVAPAPAATSPACSAGYFGTLPFKDLGLGRDMAEDGWGNMFSYAIYVDSGTPTCPGVGKDWGLASCFGAGKAGGFLLKQDATPTGGIVAVIISHGGNGLGARVAALGTQNAMPSAGPPCQELRNANGACPPDDSNTFYKGEQPDKNDDVVATLTTNDIVVPLAKQGAFKSAAAQVAADLQAMNDAYFLVKYQSCGAIPAAFGQDPWGNNYLANGECYYSTGETGTGTITTLATCASTTNAITISPLNIDAVRAAQAKAGVTVCP